jgi:nucleoside phosphorylase
MTDTLEKKVMTSSRVSGGLPGERTLKNSQATGSTSTNFIALPPKLESNTKDSVSNSNRKVYQEETAISDKPGAENEGKAVQPHHAPMLGLVAEGRTDRISDSDHKSIPEGATPTEFVVNYNHLYSGADDRISKHANVVQAKTSSRKYNTSASFQNQLSTPAIMDYKVGWICALPFETAAAEVMLDEQYSDLPLDPYSSVLYTLGRIGPHNVVIACLPRGRPGLAAASVVASEMRQRFRGIRFGFMVGIGDDIRLGDVVVSKPNFEHGGVTQYDFGKAEEGGIFRRTGHLNNPPTLLLSVLSRVETNHERGRRIYPIHMTRYLKEDMEEYLFPQNERDTLFSADYSHPTGTLDCTTCDPDQVIIRPDRNTKNTTVKIHYGTIASGNQVIKDAQTRDRIVRDLGGQVLCFEMEAAGLMNDFPCLVVRGISDYCDSHKNDGWQRYAAANAAAYTRELLLLIPSEDVVE